MKDTGQVREKATEKDPKVVPLRQVDKGPVPRVLLRRAFKMKLKPGSKVEYKRRHDEIWPELSRVLANAGVLDYSIYLDEETDTLFAFQKLAPGHTSEDLPNNPVVRKWWDYMADIMECESDNTPATVLLAEMFHMD